jgi:hypothetical protein
LSEDDLRAIASEQDKFVDHVGGVTLLNMEEWGDQTLARKVERALVKDVDNSIITPGKGDAPIWTNNEVGKLLFQFKKFAWASNQRMLIGGLQAGLGSRDLATLSSMVNMIALGALAVTLKDINRNAGKDDRDLIKDRSPEQWAIDAVNASGLLALSMELDITSDKVFGQSIQRGITGDQSTKAQERDALGQLFGPAFGLTSDLVSAAQNVAREDFTQSDLHKLRKIAPAQNLVGLRTLLDAAERGVGEGLGLEETQRRRSRATQNPVSF